MRYQDIISEALDMRTAKKWTRGRDRNFHEDVFAKFANSSPHNTKYRIYFPLDLAPEVESKEEICADKARKLTATLSSWGYDAAITAQGYMDGLLDYNGRQMRIGKLLTKARSEQEKNSTLWRDIGFAKKHFDEDDARKFSKIGKVATWVVISRHAYDVAGMSTNRGWSSCYDINKEEFISDFKDVFKTGMVASYLIKEGDWNIQHPMARVGIEYDENDGRGIGKFFPHQMCYMAREAIVYGVPAETFGKFILDWCKQANS